MSSQQVVLVDDASVAPGRAATLRERAFYVWVGVLAVLLMAALTGDRLAPYDPGAQDVVSKLLPPFATSPSGLHVMGTDPLGRDLLSNVIAGTRLTLVIAVISTLLGLVLGVAVGLIAGYYGGWVDRVMMSATEAQTAMPMFLVAILFLIVLGPSVLNVVLILPSLVWPVYARQVRAETLRLRESLFVEAAVATGCTSRAIMWSHLLPNVAQRIAVLTVLEVGHVMLAEAGLSFLGVGVQPPDTTWGLLIAKGRPYLAVAWWLPTLPGIMLGIATLALNMLARRFEAQGGSAA